MKKYDREITPNEFAKELILEELDKLLEGYWLEAYQSYDWETHEEVFEGMTQKESEEVKKMLIKRVKGVYKYLGYIRHDLEEVA